MKRVIAALALIGMVFTTAACSGSPEEQMIKYMEELASTVDANKDDCDKMAKALKPLAEKGKALKEKFSKLEGDKKPKEPSEDIKKRMADAMGKMTEGMKKCRDHKDIKALKGMF